MVGPLLTLGLSHTSHPSFSLFDDLYLSSEVVDLLGQLFALPHLLPQLSFYLFDVGPILVHYLGLHLLLYFYYFLCLFNLLV